MKNLLYIIFAFVSATSFSQMKIDTTQVEYKRYEWRIAPQTKDTTFTSKLTKYKSGFYFEEFKHLIDSTDKYGNFLIYESKEDNTSIKPKRIHVHSFGNALLTYHFDTYGNRDSLVAILYNPKYKKIVIPFAKKYKRKGKLEFLADEDGINYYKYNIFGRLKRIEYFQDSVLYKISEYRKNRLISETYPTRKKYRKKYTYAYDKKGRIIKKDNNDYYFYRYAYNEFGLNREEKVRKKKDIVEEYTLFTYNENGRLIRKKRYRRKNRLIAEYYYTYE
ncbi:hypothetical protein [Kordia sp.]|uniref:hypothetical protein n=1 Tax=Kordia sp. TaxID=1965332 RepID=UPI003D6B65DE